MKNHFRFTTFIIAALLAVTLAFSGCSNSSSADEVKASVIGEWGRLDETMHYFYSDMTCIIGGIQGTYDIDDDLNLLLTPMDGTQTTYEWAQSSGDADTSNYWYLDGDTLTVNGNTFTRITDEAETADSLT